MFPSLFSLKSDCSGLWGWPSSCSIILYPQRLGCDASPVPALLGPGPSSFPSWSRGAENLWRCQGRWIPKYRHFGGLCRWGQVVRVALPSHKVSQMWSCGFGVGGSSRWSRKTPSPSLSAVCMCFWRRQSLWVPPRWVYQHLIAYSLWVLLVWSESWDPSALTAFSPKLQHFRIPVCLLSRGPPLQPQENKNSSSFSMQSIMIFSTEHHV